MKLRQWRTATETRKRLAIEEEKKLKVVFFVVNKHVDRLARQNNVD